MIATRDSWNT